MEATVLLRFYVLPLILSMNFAVWLFLHIMNGDGNNKEQRRAAAKRDNRMLAIMLAVGAVAALIPDGETTHLIWRLIK